MSAWPSFLKVLAASLTVLSLLSILMDTCTCQIENEPRRSHHLIASSDERKQAALGNSVAMGKRAVLIHIHFPVARAGSTEGLLTSCVG